jgi:hypothetical protein
MTNEPEVRPKPGTQAQPPAAEETASTTDGKTPESSKIPALQAVFAGNPPAVSVPVGTEDPELNTIWNEREPLMKAGIAFYKSLSGQTGVIFNALKLHPDVLKQADKAGRLQEVAPPFDAVEKALPFLARIPPRNWHLRHHPARRRRSQGTALWYLQLLQGHSKRFRRSALKQPCPAAQRLE